ncbi:PREDICTED: ATP-dependent DNA helicase PIF2-like [Camelina sativa]|uniref:ATP-dependent DNA helicase n=1 Tax=Camelina sativa TaxID=90675 RepID=A0ABM1QFL8_CAMSA|nr:PREDICTED: ATP-dependent DNA helicase PIF2-like [Camelina sativa]
MDAVLTKRGGAFFVYGFGGTGKTFLWKTLSAALRKDGEIVLNVASSGIASLLLAGDLGKLVREASLIIWDEAPMMSKYCFESLDRSLKDVVENGHSKPFGGKVVVFGGDFRQVLPVITGGSRTEIVMATLNSSYLWDHCKVLKLTKNMRLLAKDISVEKATKIKEFSEWILDVGDGKIAEPNDGVAEIDIPEGMLITEATNPIEAISKEVYGDPQFLKEKNDPKFFQARAILAPTNEDVYQINEYMLDQMEGDERIYLSADSLDPSDKVSKNNPIFTPDFLNSIKLSGLPHHRLRLKIGCPGIK